MFALFSRPLTRRKYTSRASRCSTRVLVAKISSHLLIPPKAPMRPNLLHLRRTAMCQPAQWRPFVTPVTSELHSARYYSSTPNPPPPKQSTPPTPPPEKKPKAGTPKIPSVVEYEKVPTSEREIRKSKPPQLVRPIGVAKPPQPGENSGIDSRSWAERRHDMVDYDLHKDRRTKM